MHITKLGHCIGYRGTPKMGIERITVTARIDPENRIFLEDLVMRLSPLRITLSSLINSLITYVRLRASHKDLHLVLLQGQRNDRPITSVTYTQLEENYMSLVHSLYVKHHELEMARAAAPKSVADTDKKEGVA